MSSGLSGEEAARRRETYGPNLVVQHRRRSIPVQLLLRFGNPLVLLLLGAAALAGATGDVRSLVVILVMEKPCSIRGGSSNRWPRRCW